MKLSEAVKILSDAGIENARHDAKELFLYIGSMGKTRFFGGDVESDLPQLEAAVYRRAKREPLQYILGITHFYRECYDVDEGCLIPRPDTDILVDYAVNNIPKGKSFVDLCTGSGCVGISTLRNTDSTVAMLVDISERAIALAKRNAVHNEVEDRCVCITADVLDAAVIKSCFAVLANPPYVKDVVYGTLAPEIFFEPRIAFVGGEDGADFYRRLVPIYKDVIEDDGFIAFEIGFDQADILREIAEQNRMSCEIIKDYSGNDRVAVLRRP